MVGTLNLNGGTSTLDGRYASPIQFKYCVGAFLKIFLTGCKEKKRFKNTLLKRYPSYLVASEYELFSYQRLQHVVNKKKNQVCSAAIFWPKFMAYDMSVEHFDARTSGISGVAPA